MFSLKINNLFIWEWSWLDNISVKNFFKYRNTGNPLRYFGPRRWDEFESFPRDHHQKPDGERKNISA